MAGGMDSSLQHQAFVYASRDDFISSMAPFARNGLARGDTVFAATTRANGDALREELGYAADRLVLHDTTEWRTRPYERLQALRELVGGLSPGATLRAMGEPVWAGSDAEVRQWARYESIINLALARAPMRFVCLYDGSALPDRILDHAMHTHAERVVNGSVEPSAAYVSPHEFAAGTLAEPPSTALELPSEAAALREQLETYAVASGMDPDRAGEFVIAVNEIVGNAAIHGSDPVRVRAWTQEGELVCQIADAGPGIGDPLAGWLPPSSPTGGGWGLPIARQLCDALEIFRREAETVVSLHVSR